MAPKILDFGFNNIDLWRSEAMQLVSIMLPTESAHECIHALGEVGLLQFKDLNGNKSAFQRNYASQVRRCDEMARRLRFFQDQVHKAGLEQPAPVAGSDLGGSIATHFSFDALEAKLEELEKELLETNSNMERLQRSHSELKEMQLVLDTAGNFFDSRATAQLASAGDALGNFSEGESPLLEALGGDKVAKVGFVAGTIQQEKVLAFERLLFRATRGNVFLKQGPPGIIKDPATGEEQSKVVFVVFFAGERAQAKINKICEVFNANKYPFPEDIARQRQTSTEVSGRLRELQSTNEAGDRRRDAVLRETASQLEEWVTTVRKEKAVYHTLNKLSMDVTSKVLIAEAWVPVFAQQQVAEVLARTGQASHTQLAAAVQPIVNTQETPPTHFRTNKFTYCFQTIVDAYGVARYREVNPAVLTLMTFPFLFAVMFGDVGHAALMLLFSGYMIFKEKHLMKQDLGDMISLLFAGRYCILLMGIFSVYTGFMYNEFFSMPMEIFGRTGFRCWQPYAGIDGLLPRETGYAPKGFDSRNCKTWGGELKWPEDQHVYNFGIDPVWHGRKTELPFLNSLKMKMSIILGVVHMDFGIINSLYNNLFFKDAVSLIFEFIPQMLFLNLIFGYLCILIISKWVSGSYADLYHVMINMFLKPGSMDAQGQVFEGQGGLQVFLLLIALICVPIMLLPKPFILRRRHRQSLSKKHDIEMTGLMHEENGSSTSPAHAGGGGGDAHGEHGEFDFSEILVHQMIHTIEFVLGSVSNTASYLRLWALSLAHSQLSSVFYDRVLMAAIDMDNIGAVFIAFFVFACATLGVLMVMESLSAFLHALRLHWVEYQNKFYKGDGYQFMPFSFKEILAEKDDEAQPK